MNVINKPVSLTNMLVNHNLVAFNWNDALSKWIINKGMIESDSLCVIIG